MLRMPNEHVTKLCKDCKHHKRTWLGTARCLRFGYTDPVAGGFTPDTCQLSRIHPCSAAATGWEPKQ